MAVGWGRTEGEHLVGKGDPWSWRLWGRAVVAFCKRLTCDRAVMQKAG